MSDDKLREAIRDIHVHADVLAEHAAIVWPSQIPFFRGLAAVAKHMATAAESTLPKTKMVGFWKVNGCGRNFAPYSVDVEATDTPELFVRIREMMESSFNRITIVYDQREVPA